MRSTVEVQSGGKAHAPLPGRWAGAARGRRSGRSLRTGLRVKGLIPSAGATICQRSAPTASQVVVSVDEAGYGHVGGIQRCGSIASCPVCAPIIRGQRAAEIDEGVRAQLRKGGRVAMVTATFQHSRNDSLAQSFGDVLDCWSSMWSGGGSQELRAALGMGGQIRVVEATYGEANGWHPHIHALLFLDGSTSVRSVSSRLKQAWASTVERRSGRQVHDVIGLDVSEVTESNDVARYLSKVEGGWGPGCELARADSKKSDGRFTPWEILEAAVDGEAWALRRWIEWEHATYGRRIIQWTPGLRAELGLGRERSDEECSVEEVTGRVVHQVIYTAEVWNLAVDTGREWVLIAQAEQQAVDLGLVRAPVLQVLVELPP